jgi:hypothetical protein
LSAPSSTFGLSLPSRSHKPQPPSRPRPRSPCVGASPRRAYLQKEAEPSLLPLLPSPLPFFACVRPQLQHHKFTGGASVASASATVSEPPPLRRLRLVSSLSSLLPPHAFIFQFSGF